MKNIEKTIVTLENIQKTLADVGYNKFDPDYNDLCDIITDLKFELASKNAKESGKTNVNTVVKRILKYSDNENMRKIHGVNGNNYVLDGHILVKLPADFNIAGYEVSNNPYNCENIMKNRNALDMHYKAIDLSKYGWNVKEIKSHIKTIKAKGHKDKAHFIFVVNVDGVQVAFNPNYLIDCMEATKSSVIYIGKRVEPMFMYGENDDTEALFLPIRFFETTTKTFDNYVGLQIEYDNK